MLDGDGPHSISRTSLIQTRDCLLHHTKSCCSDGTGSKFRRHFCNYEISAPVYQKATQLDYAAVRVRAK